METKRRPDLQPLGPVNFARNVETLTPKEVRHVRFTVETTNNGSEPCLDELELWTAGNDSRNVAGDAKLMSSGDYLGNPKHKLIHLNDGKYGNEHGWISNTKGKGWVQLELPEPVKIERIEWGRDRNQRYKDRLPTKYRIEGALDPVQWSMLADSSQRLPFDTKYTHPNEPTTSPPTPRRRLPKAKPNWPAPRKSRRPLLPSPAQPRSTPATLNNPLPLACSSVVIH